MKHTILNRRLLTRPSTGQLAGVMLTALLFSSPSFAYVGPGLGLGVLGTLFGIFAAIVLAAFGLFWYPMKRAFARKPATNEGADPNRQKDSPTD